MIHPTEEILLTAAPPPKPNSDKSLGNERIEKNVEGVKLWGNLFSEVSKVPGVPERGGILKIESNSKDSTTENELKLRSVNLRIKENMRIHDTSFKHDRNPIIVLKRGLEFQFDLMFNQQFGTSSKFIKCVFEKENRSEKEDEVEDHFTFVIDSMPPKIVEKQSWIGNIEFDNDELSILLVKLKISQDAHCGFWRLVIFINHVEDAEVIVPGIKIVE